MVIACLTILASIYLASTASTPEWRHQEITIWAMEDPLVLPCPYDQTGMNNYELKGYNLYNTNYRKIGLPQQDNSSHNVILDSSANFTWTCTSLFWLNSSNPSKNKLKWEQIVIAAISPGSKVEAKVDDDFFTCKFSYATVLNGDNSMEYPPQNMTSLEYTDGNKIDINNKSTETVSCQISNQDHKMVNCAIHTKFPIQEIRGKSVKCITHLPKSSKTLTSDYVPIPEMVTTTSTTTRITAITIWAMEDPLVLPCPYDQTGLMSYELMGHNLTNTHAKHLEIGDNKYQQRYNIILDSSANFTWLCTSLFRLNSSNSSQYMYVKWELNVKAAISPGSKVEAKVDDDFLTCKFSYATVLNGDNSMEYPPHNMTSLVGTDENKIHINNTSTETVSCQISNQDHKMVNCAIHTKFPIQEIRGKSVKCISHLPKSSKTQTSDYVPIPEMVTTTSTTTRITAATSTKIDASAERIIKEAPTTEEEEIGDERSSQLNQTAAIVVPILVFITLGIAIAFGMVKTKKRLDLQRVRKDSTRAQYINEFFELMKDETEQTRSKLSLLPSATEYLEPNCSTYHHYEELI